MKRDKVDNVLDEWGWPLNTIGGKWWELFQDPQLNALEEHIDVGNQNIADAAASCAAARAAVRETRSQYFPTLTTTPSMSYTNSRLAVTLC